MHQYLFSFLTKRKKLEMLPALLDIQQGFTCFYCHEPLEGTTWIYEHLDNDRQHNVIDNIRLAHQSCNIKKINYIEYQVMAKDELEKGSEKCLCASENDTEQHYSSEIAISVKARKYTKQFVTERVSTDGSILFNEALWAIVNDLNEKYNCGSETAVRKYLNALCSITGKFKIIRNDAGKREIVRRTEN